MSSRWLVRSSAITRAIALTAAALVGASIREVLARRQHTIQGILEPEAAPCADPVPTPAATAEPESPPSSILANRLAIDLDGPPPTLDELDLQEAKDQAFAWQQQRSHASLNDMHGHISGRPGGRWVSEVHGIMGVVAEQVLLSIEAESEKVICVEALGGTASTLLENDSTWSRRAFHRARDRSASKPAEFEGRGGAEHRPAAECAACPSRC